MRAHYFKGIGRQMMRAMQAEYAGFHQQMLTADTAAASFYEAMGFTRAGETVPMWIYQGAEH
jgi:ribosomal protein S18 acetylase RimI-like enzyme